MLFCLDDCRIESIRYKRLNIKEFDFKSININSFYKFLNIILKEMDYLYCGCPVLDCPNRATISYWYHAGCGAKTMLRYDDINIVCSSCKTSDLIFHWNFSCKAHGYKPASLQGCIYAMAIMAQQTSDQYKIRIATQKLLDNWPR